MKTKEAKKEVKKEVKNSVRTFANSKTGCAVITVQTMP